MVSRDIANMHLFLEMKKKFPELPEDIIRRNIQQWPGDHKKCLQFLYNEHQNIICPKQVFSADQQSMNVSTGEGACRYRRKSVENSDFEKNRFKDLSLNSSSHQRNKKNHFKHSEKMIFVSSGTLQSDKLQVPLVQSSNSPKGHSVSVTYKRSTVPGCEVALIHPVQNSSDFVSCPASTANGGVASRVDCSRESRSSRKQHKVSLSFIPNLPHYQQNIVSERHVSAISSHTSSADHHVTSVHLQLQPNLPHKPVMKISAATRAPLLHSNDRKYNSHVQISFTSNGATFCAQRTENLRDEICSSDTRSELIGSKSLPNDVKSSSEAKFAPCEVARHVCSKSYHQKTLQPLVTEMNSKLDCDKLSSCEQSMTSPSSLQIETKEAFPRRKLSGQMPRESRYPQPYIQAVIHHQRLRLEILRKEFVKENLMYNQLREEVVMLEKELCQSHRGGFSAVFNPTVLKQLIEENEKLKNECNFLLKCADVVSATKGSS